MLDEAFGAILKAERVERGWSREELAERAGAGNAKTVWAHEVGRKDPHLATIRRYATALAIPCGRLLDGEGR